MRLVFSEPVWNDYLWFQERDQKLAKRINALLKETMRTPSTGTGKPERLGATYPAIGRAESIMSTAWCTPSKMTN